MVDENHNLTDKVLYTKLQQRLSTLTLTHGVLDLSHGKRLFLLQYADPLPISFDHF